MRSFVKRSHRFRAPGPGHAFLFSLLLASLLVNEIFNACDMQEETSPPRFPRFLFQRNFERKFQDPSEEKENVPDERGAIGTIKGIRGSKRERNGTGRDGTSSGTIAFPATFSLVYREFSVRLALSRIRARMHISHVCERRARSPPASTRCNIIITRGNHFQFPFVRGASKRAESVVAYVDPRRDINYDSYLITSLPILTRLRDFERNSKGG